MPEPEDSYAHLVGALADLGIRWALAGALAAERYREHARLTTDVDLLVEWHPDLVRVVESQGFDTRVYRDEGDDPHLIRARSRADDRYVDFLVALTDYQQEALDRAASNDHVLTVEDVLVHKLIANRPRDREDIASIMSAVSHFDGEYVRRWARYFGFENRLSSIGLD